MAIVANKYAKALFDASKDAEILDSVYDEFSIIHEAVQSEIPNLVAMDQDPQIDGHHRRRIVGIVFGNSNQYIQNMLMILASNRHLGLIDKIYNAFTQLYNAFYNRDYAVVESVYELSEQELSEIETIITNKTQLSKVILSNEINPALIGGIRINVGTKVMDASIQNDLAQLEKHFKRVN